MNFKWYVYVIRREEALRMKEGDVNQCGLDELHITAFDTIADPKPNKKIYLMRPTRSSFPVDSVSADSVLEKSEQLLWRHIYRELLCQTMMTDKQIQQQLSAHNDGRTLSCDGNRADIRPGVGDA